MGCALEFPLTRTTKKDCIWGLQHKKVVFPITTKSITANGGLDGGLNLTEREQQVISIIKVQPDKTLEAIADEIGISKRTVERTISSLRQRGIIEKDGSKKSGMWVVKD